ncbi:MAG: hypothetical protein Q7R40_10840 [Phaeospirillum sp.]|nr:hypothetical protein [Phaeospirillum sp.]
MSAAALVSPMTGHPLMGLPTGFQAEDGTLYPTTNGITDLLDVRLADAAMQAELDVFETIPIEKVCYFRSVLFQRILGLVLPLMRAAGVPPACVEIGGGEGYLAGAFHHAAPDHTGYVCDLSIRALGNADPALVRLRADVRFPYLPPNSLGLAAFWVSLHHFSSDDARRSLDVAVSSLAPGGLLLAFEPNDDFLPRHQFSRMRISRQVYFDDEEKSLNWRTIDALARAAELRLRHCVGVNPPYSLPFLRHFRLWPLFLIATETLYRFDRLFKHDSRWWRAGESGPLGLGTGSYLLGVWQKPFSGTGL